MGLENGPMGKKVIYINKKVDNKKYEVKEENKEKDEKLVKKLKILFIFCVIIFIYCNFYNSS